MARVFPIVIVILTMIYSVVEVAQARPDEVRRAPRWLWAAAIILIPAIGALCWLTLGRPTARSREMAEADRHPVAPDDDPDFLRRLR